jgi:hypothetical protein
MFSSERNRVMKEYRQFHNEELKNNCNPFLIENSLYRQDDGLQINHVMESEDRPLWISW